MIGVDDGGGKGPFKLEEPANGVGNSGGGGGCGGCSPAEGVMLLLCAQQLVSS